LAASSGTESVILKLMQALLVLIAGYFVLNSLICCALLVYKETAIVYLIQVGGSPSVANAMHLTIHSRTALRVALYLPNGIYSQQDKGESLYQYN